MKTIPELLSGQFDEELRVLVAEARGWTNLQQVSDELQPAIKRLEGENFTLFGSGSYEVSHYSTSLDACRELLVDLTEEEWDNLYVALADYIGDNSDSIFWCGDRRDLAKQLMCLTALQICIAYLIVKGVLK